MTPEASLGLLSYLRDVGTAGAVIFVMLVFLKYIRSRDETMEKALNSMTEAFNRMSLVLKDKDKDN
jgi:hypothetical protein